MARWLLVCVACGVAGCARSTADILRDREQVKLYATNAQQYLEAGDLQRAEHQARKALEVDPVYTKAQSILGFVLIQRAQAATGEAQAQLFAEAEAILDAVTREAGDTDVNVFKSHYFLGCIATLRAETAGREATACAARAARGGATDAEAEDWRRRDREATDLAIRHFRNALLTSRDHFDQARRSLILALTRGGRTDEALRQADEYCGKIEAAVQDRQEKRAACAADTALDATARGRKLLEYDRHLRELRLDLVRMLELKAGLLARNKAWDAAREALTHALTLDPDYSLLRYQLALVQAETGERVPAIESLHRFLEQREAAGRRLGEKRLEMLAAGAPEAERERLEREIADVAADRAKVRLFAALLAIRDGRPRDAREQLAPLLVAEPGGLGVDLAGVAGALAAGRDADALQLCQRFVARLEREAPGLGEIRTHAVALAESIEVRVSGKR